MLACVVGSKMASPFVTTCEKAGFDGHATEYVTVGLGFKSTLMFLKVAADEDGMMRKVWDPFLGGKTLRDVEYKCAEEDQMVMECAFRCLWTECQREEKKKDEVPQPAPGNVWQMAPAAAEPISKKAPKALKKGVWLERIKAFEEMYVPKRAFPEK